MIDSDKYKIPISKNDINFYGDTEKERKANELIFDLTMENDRLNNIINELEEWLTNVDIFQMNFIENKEHITPYKAVLEKIKELKEG